MKWEKEKKELLSATERKIFAVRMQLWDAATSGRQEGKHVDGTIRSAKERQCTCQCILTSLSAHNENN